MENCLEFLDITDDRAKLATERSFILPIYEVPGLMWPELEISFCYELARRADAKVGDNCSLQIKTLLALDALGESEVETK